jgi:xanthine dehydrogenase YagS FAD-binding subunit
MKAFDLRLPNSLEEAIALLPEAEGDESSRLLAGGQDLLTELKHHLVEPDRLVNLKTVPGLSGITHADDGGCTIGALTTLQDLYEDAGIVERFPALAQAARSVASPQIRAQATLGGNLNQRPRCWYYRAEEMVCLKKGGRECFSQYGRNKYNAILGAGPSWIVHPSDCAPALVALGAEVTIRGPRGERRQTLEETYVLPSEGNVLRETDLAPNEVMTAIHLPAPVAGQRSVYLKFKERGSYDFAVGAVAIRLEMDGATIRSADVVLGAVAPVPWRARSAEAKAAGGKLDDATIAAVREAALEGAEPLSENGYKIPLTKGLITRAPQSLA